MLEAAIADVGYWCWWAADPPRAVQVEFGGVQLYRPPAKAGEPPSGKVALRFVRPSFAAFLTFGAGEGQGAPGDDWPRRLHEGTAGVFSLDDGEFTLTDATGWSGLVSSATRAEALPSLGTPPDSAGALLAFRAGAVGFAVAAERMDVLTFAGPVAAEEVGVLHDAWWDYWREYWARRDTDSPLPRDYACEVTIPVEVGPGNG